MGWVLFMWWNVGSGGLPSGYYAPGCWAAGDVIVGGFQQAEKSEGGFQEAEVHKSGFQESQINCE